MGRDEYLQELLASLSELKPAQWCQAFFLLAAGGVAAVAAMPRDAKTLMMDYGARQSQQKQSAGKSSAKSPSRGRLVSLIGFITSCSQVPHSWFSIFYAVSLACSVFWLAQYLCDGTVLHRIASSQAGGQGPSATLGQVALGWLMMFLQAARRVFEHATVLKPSKSTMWVVHWVLGLFFYLAIGVSVWVEGSGKACVPTRWHEIRLLTAA
jgi:3-oxo-5-alpha-steroid 4-dehydrogenase 3